MSQQAAVIKKAAKKRSIKLQDSKYEIRSKWQKKNIIPMLPSWLMLYACVRMQVARLRAVYEL